MPDGIFTSLDNRRLYAFQKANKPIATIERSLDEILTAEQVGWYSLPNKPNPVTYRDAFNFHP